MNSELFCHEVWVLPLFSRRSSKNKKSLEEGMSSELFCHEVWVLFSALQQKQKESRGRHEQ
jgi:hypothetical protein